MFSTIGRIFYQQTAGPHLPCLKLLSFASLFFHWGILAALYQKKQTKSTKWLFKCELSACFTKDHEFTKINEFMWAQGENESFNIYNSIGFSVGVLWSFKFRVSSLSLEIWISLRIEISSLIVFILLDSLKYVKNMKFFHHICRLTQRLIK